MADAPPPASKNNSSYTYWVRQRTDEAAPAPVPRRLSESDLSSHAQPPPLGSLWNQAGTWEEKNLSSWATKRIKELLLAIEPLHFPHGLARLIEVSNCTGEATLVTVRNKKRVGYSYEITMRFEGEWKDAKGLQGTLKVPEACFNDLDELQLEVSLSEDKDTPSLNKNELAEALQSFLPAIREKLEKFEQELKER